MWREVRAVPERVLSALGPCPPVGLDAVDRRYAPDSENE